MGRWCRGLCTSGDLAVREGRNRYTPRCRAVGPPPIHCTPLAVPLCPASSPLADRVAVPLSPLPVFPSRSVVLLAPIRSAVHGNEGAPRVGFPRPLAHLSSRGPAPFVRLAATSGPPARRGAVVDWEQWCRQTHPGCGGPRRTWRWAVRGMQWCMYAWGGVSNGQTQGRGGGKVGRRDEGSRLGRRAGGRAAATTREQQRQEWGGGEGREERGVPNDQGRWGLVPPPLPPRWRDGRGQRCALFSPRGDGQSGPASWRWPLCAPTTKLVVHFVYPATHTA